VPIDDDNMGDVALYVEDITHGPVTVCGTITEILEKETKNGKPFYIFRIDDTTGTIGGLYFTRKTTLARIKEIQVGDAIIASGEMSDYNGKPSLKFEKINRCTFPKNFVKKERYKKSVPREYKNIFPSPATIVKVSSVFDDVFLPDELVNDTFVVFDLETTGLDLMNNGITEIGAVKIEKGVIKEHFTTLIKPDYPISEEITKLTGITQEMVKDSPKISTVIPDFMKFIEGAILVAHNAEFDLKFIKRFAGAEEYEINNKVLDTMDMTRKYLPQLRQANLKVLAEHFGIVFRHHRALSDAYATAEAFIELMKIKNGR
jgi:DNA polymerase III epsilon subunit family exonuclease